MEYKLHFGRLMIEQMRTMSSIVRDLKVVGQDVPEQEQVLNVIQALLDTKH